MRDIARAEYFYFSGQPERGAELAEPYLLHADLSVRLSACLIYAYANLSVGHIGHARHALAEIQDVAASLDESAPAQLRAATMVITATAAVLLHLPMPVDVPRLRHAIALLPPGLRAFSFYTQAHQAYLEGDYGRGVGIAETALALGGEAYPIPAIYLRLAAVMSCMPLKRTDEAKAHLLAAWDMARPDDLIEGLGEHHGLLGGMLEAVIKPEWPDDFKRIIAITYRFSAGWRRVHNPDTGHNVADNLTTTEFATCMLAARGWTNKEIAAHLGVSPNMAKTFISSALGKLGIDRRQDLKDHMLA